VLVVTAGFGVFAVWDAGAATYTYSCHSAPGDLESANDAAIEVRHLRQESADDCVALAERLAAVVTALELQDDTNGSGVVQRVQLETDQRAFLELAAWGALLTFGGVLFLVIAPQLTGSFRLWRDI